MNTICAIAVALHEASQPEFKTYGQQILENAKAMANEFLNLWYSLVTGGTDNHMIVVDFSDKDIDGSKAEKLLDEIGISTSKSTIPDDPNPPFRPSGLRIGTPAMTTRGMTPDMTREIVWYMDEAFKSWGDEEVLSVLKDKIVALAKSLPVQAWGM